jgi:hypothetical protein
MDLFLIIAIAVVVLLAVGMWYGVITDPARIDEEEDKEADAETPAERQGFLRSWRLTKEEQEDRIAEASKTGYDENEI